MRLIQRRWFRKLSRFPRQMGNFICISLHVQNCMLMLAKPLRSKNSFAESLKSHRQTVSAVVAFRSPKEDGNLIESVAICCLYLSLARNIKLGRPRNLQPSTNEEQISRSLQSTFLMFIQDTLVQNLPKHSEYHQTQDQTRVAL